jgi:hypothetical protein
MSGRFADSPERIRKIEARYDKTARKIFSKPANYCQFCGREMGEHEDAMTNRWQQRWSIHKACADSVDGQLDRSVGMSLERPKE